MKKLLLLFAFLLPNKATAQDYSHTGLWSRFGLNIKLTKQINIIAEYSHRLQSDYHISYLNPTEAFNANSKKLTFTFTKKHWVFYFTPYEGTKSKLLLSKESDFLQPIVDEIRLSGGVEYVKEFAKNKFQFRNIYEYRDMTDAIRSRWRTRLQIQVPFDEKNSIKISDEFFLNLPPNKFLNDFSQNRLFFTLNHQFSKHFDFETGYLYLLSERNTLTEFDHLNAWVVYLTVKL
jgi:hypothetical protein